MEALLHEPKTWIALAFFIFFGLFIRYAMQPILGMLDKRSDEIKEELEEAVRLREAAQALLADYQNRQKDMTAEAESILAQAKVEAESLRKQAEIDLKQSIERRTKMAHDKIARAQSDALADIQSIMVDLSVGTTRKLLEQELDDSQRDKLVKDTLSDIKRLIH